MGIEEMKAVDIRTVDPESLVDVTGILISDDMTKEERAAEFVKQVKKSKYYLHNIVLGILGKTGGIPWIVKDMPGNVDCFVGLDVATVAKGIHYPACSVVFDKYGRLLGFYKPTTPQQGEKITTKISLMRNLLWEIVRISLLMKMHLMQ